jgi:hypothetical protein
MTVARLLSVRLCEAGCPNATACCLVQGNTMPSVPAHGASFRGAPVDFEVLVMHQSRRFRVASHQNAYIGALRRQVRTHQQLHAPTTRGCLPQCLQRPLPPARLCS